VPPNIEVVVPDNMLAAPAPNCVQLAVVRAGNNAAEEKDSALVLYHASVKVAVADTAEPWAEISVIIMSKALLLRKLKVTFPLLFDVTKMEQTDVCANDASTSKLIPKNMVRNLTTWVRVGKT
jgi:hypothetical protein